MVDPVSIGPAKPVRGHPEVAVSGRQVADASRAAPVEKKSLEGRNAQSLPKLLSTARELAEQGPPVDNVKIAAVRRAIMDGSYEVKPAAIAASIFNAGGAGG